jgi:hypothetical protein
MMIDCRYRLRFRDRKQTYGTSADYSPYETQFFHADSGVSSREAIEIVEQTPLAELAGDGGFVRLEDHGVRTSSLRQRAQLRHVAE